MGGKSCIIDVVWSRLGDCPNAVDPFFGSNAFLLGRPESAAIAAGDTSRIETVNDLNAWLCNFWRAVQADPDAVAYHADWPVSEFDLHARGDWLFYRPEVPEFKARIHSDPDWYDAKSAGWWVWGQSSWIGDNWGERAHNAKKDKDGNAVGVTGARPHLGRGAGVNRQLPHLGNAGEGVNRKRPHLGGAGKGMGINRILPRSDSNTVGQCEIKRANLTAYMRQIADRFRSVRVCCGNWRRVCTPAVTTVHGMTAVFLDPPYGVADRADCYGAEDSRSVAGEVLEWCKVNGPNPLLRIALCGYEGEHNDLEAMGWDKHEWKTGGGYSNQSSRGNDNAKRERIWFSPHCIKPTAGPLMEFMEGP